MSEKIEKKLAKILVIVGPTAVGKTALSIRLAKKYNGEIINGDSMQVYAGLDIGTAKVTEEETEGIPHHLLDIVPVDQDYTASDFKRDARAAIASVLAKGKLPIVVGGSGLYIEGLLFDMQFGGVAAEDPGYRKQLEAELERTDAMHIWKRLQEKDPEAAEQIHPNNSRRVIRALEVIHFSGKRFSDQADKEADPHYDALLIGLDTDRSILYERINRRVDLMVAAGLVEEAKALFDRQLPAKTQATRGIGYKEWFGYFDAELTFEEAAELLKQNSRRYAKRQLTWFRNRMSGIHWFDLVQDAHELQKIEGLVESFLM